MNTHIDPATLKTSAATAKPAPEKITPVVLGAKQALEIAIEAVKKATAARGATNPFGTVHKIEEMGPTTFANHSVAGTPFEPIVNAFNAHGATTEANLGGCMATMYPDLNDKERQDKAHDLICFCHEESAVIAGGTVVERLTKDFKAT